MPRIRRPRRRGYALLTGAACSVCMLGMLGLSVDLGRLYIARNEAQTFADSAAIEAALELDGTLAGVARARAAVAANGNRWHMENLAFTDTSVDFGRSSHGPWIQDPASAEGLRFARVRAAADPPLYFIPIVSRPSRGRVVAAAVAGQVFKSEFREGIFPFSPLAHDLDDPEFGFVRGRRYTLHWPARPRLHENVCEGDDEQALLDRILSGAPWRGYSEDPSPFGIREAVEGDRMTHPLSTGDALNPAAAHVHLLAASLVSRVRQDQDPVSKTYEDYAAGGRGNGRRLIVVPVHSGGPEFRVAGFAAFFLLEPAAYQAEQDAPFCAEFVGAHVRGSSHRGAGGAGAFAVRLVQ